MSTVTKCDMCGSVIPHEESKRIKTYTITKDNKPLRIELELDMCRACSDKMYAFIEGGKSK